MWILLKHWNVFMYKGCSWNSFKGYNIYKCRLNKKVAAQKACWTSNTVCTVKSRIPIGIWKQITCNSIPDSQWNCEIACHSLLISFRVNAFHPFRTYSLVMPLFITTETIREVPILSWLYLLLFYFCFISCPITSATLLF